MATAAAAATTVCEEVEVTVKQSDGSEVVLIVQLGDTVVDFQTRLAAQTQVPVPRQRLKLGVKELRRDTLALCGVKAGATITLEDKDGWKHAHGPVQAALLAAIEAGDVIEVKRLLGEDGGASPQTPVTPSGMGPAHFAAMGGSAAILKELCDAGANVNQSPYEVSSVLQFAVQLYEYDTNEAISMTEILCLPPQDCPPQRSKVTARDVLGSALNFGCGRGMTPIVERLLQANADPNYFPDHDDYAFTPLIGLIYENESHPGHPIIAQLLLDAGADPRHIGRSATALGYAEDYDRRDLIPILRAAEERAANEPE
eukprot:m.151919 g.151919  ORF g.151919 m.151919 type:complete len:314 (+) comp23369_c1_seq1:333-1274(+)